MKFAHIDGMLVVPLGMIESLPAELQPLIFGRSPNQLVLIPTFKEAGAPYHVNELQLTLGTPDAGKDYYGMLPGDGEDWIHFSLTFAGGTPVE